MKNILNIENQTKFEFQYKKEFKKILDEIAIYFDEKVEIEVDVNIVDNNIIQNLSKEYYNKDKPTDVLSFPSGMELLKESMNKFYLGEIFLNYEKILDQSKEYGHSEKREFSYLFAHGLVHLFGYDHIDEKEAKNMNLIVKTIMNRANIQRT